MSEILFFCSSAALGLEDGPAPCEGLEVWRPAAWRIRPRGLSAFPFAVWWLFHHARIFRGRGYSVWLLRDRGAVIHRSCVFPLFFRFPFMGPRDVQVGDVWTAPERRGQGLSAKILRRILSAHGDKVVWFVCDAGNSASIALATGAGMKLHGVGTREPRLGVAFLGRYVIRSRPST